MSALEQIRQRPILIISILGVALLLFILTAVDRPGELFTDNHTVAKVDGEKIDYLEFQKRVEQLSQQYQSQGYTNVDRDQLQSQVLQMMINETLLNKECDKLGLTVTDTELSMAMIGENPLPAVTQQVRQMGMPDAKALYDAIANPTKAGITDPQMIAQLNEIWASLEKSTEEMLLTNKFQTLLNGSLNANKLDAQAVYDQTVKTWTIAQVSKSASTLDDKDFTPTDAELKARYDEEKEMFRLTEPVHTISYVTVDVKPSDKDLAAGRQTVNNALAALKTQPGTEGIADNAAFVVNRVSSTAAAMAPQLRNSLDKLAADTIVEVSFINSTYTLAKLLGSSTQVDSVLVDMAVVADEAMTDSLMTRLNAGAKPADLGEALQGSRDSMWTSLVDPQMALLKEELATVETGRYFAPQSAGAQKGMLLRVRQRKAPVTVYDIAQVTYVVEPSAETVDKLNADLRNFLTANNTPEKFSENAVKAGYTAFDAQVTPSTLQINGMPESRNVAKWALNAKQGAVSGVFTNERGSRLMGAAVNGVYDGKYVPLTDKRVKEYITREVVTAKKVDKLVADYKGKGKTVADYAKVMGAPVDTTTIAFGRGNAILSANVAVAQKGAVVGPVALDNAAAVFEVVNIDTQARPFNFRQDSQAFAYTQGGPSFSRAIPAILLGNKKVDNKIQKFYSDRQN